MSTKKVYYTTTKNMNKAQSLINMGTTTQQMAKMMKLTYNQGMYLRYLVNNRNQTNALNDSNIMNMINAEKPIVNRKTRVSQTVVSKQKEIDVKRNGNRITVTINLAI